jgi:CDP-diacylglycerol--glycerol-3-phosphate 3-phosphatidyltransferase
MFDGKFRQSVDARTAPVGQALVKMGVSADVLTASGLFFALVTAWLIAIGQHHWAILTLIVTGAHDLFDGPVAKASQSASKRGAFFDSVSDRVADALMLGGVSYYLIAQHRGQLALLPLGIMTTTFLISYERSKAESLGIPAKGGLMERAERMIVLGISLTASVMFVPVLWLLLALTAGTAAGRFLRVWNAASERPKREPVRWQRRARRQRRVRRHDHVHSRWRGLNRTSRP